MAVERITVDLPPALKYWLDRRVQERKAAGDRKASLRAIIVEILETEAKATSSYPVLD
jgi:hypothetical protein